MIFIFTIGASLLTSALNVKFRDVNFFVQAILLIWFYATPIVYSLSQIPLRLLWIWHFNPLTGAIQLMQAAVVGSAPPSSSMLAANIAAIVLVTAVGVIVFNRESKYFDDWL